MVGFRFKARGDDRGAAMITVVMMLGVLTALGTTVTMVTINNTRNADADRQSGNAFGVSEAGVSAALAYINANGVAGLPFGGCATPDSWCNKASPKTVSVPGTASTYKVWIEPIVPLVVAHKASPGSYRIHSTGTDGTNPGTRTVRVDVAITPFKFPIGVFGHTINAGGTGAVHYESMFTDGCIYKRSKIAFEGIDRYFGIPAAAHSSQYITDSVGSGPSCPVTDNKNIHKSAVCNPLYPYDQDAQGGPLTSGDGCYGLHAGTYPTTSHIDAASIYTTYDFQPPGLSASQLEALRVSAQQQGFYFTNTTAIPAVLQPADAWKTRKHPVLFYDLKGGSVGGTVDLKDLTGYSRPSDQTANSASCTGASAVVIVMNGNVAMNGNTTLAAHIFALSPSPHGQIGKLNGGFQLIGTIYANQIDLTGTGDIHLDDCALQNLPGPLFGLALSNFVEVDR